MGRVTYEALSRYAVSQADAGSKRLAGLPKLVFSNTLREPLAWSNTNLIKGDVADAIADPQTSGWPPAPLHRQHHAGKDDDAARIGRPTAADDLSPRPWKRGQGADLCRLS